MSQATTAPPLHPSMQRTVFPVLLAVSFCHLLNDMIQSLLPAIYPILKGTYGCRAAGRAAWGDCCCWRGRAATAGC